jgi:glycosyltransferase involved in cell wall biosynthesis
VAVHVNASGAELRELYDRASMYWHSTGFGVDATTEPERLEHFGIAVVEAMARGCVPIVYGAGGPAEIVEHGASGLHWRTLDDLCEMTRSVMTNETMRATLSLHALIRAGQFGERQFGSTLGSVVAELFGESASRSSLGSR